MNDIVKSIYKNSKKPKAWAPCLARKHTNWHHHRKPRERRIKLHLQQQTQGLSIIVISVSDGKQINEGKHKETLQHCRKPQHQLYANKTSINYGYYEVTKENKGQGREVQKAADLDSENSHLFSQEPVMLTLTTSTNGWNQKQIKWAKHQLHKRRLFLICTLKKNGGGGEIVHLQ